MSIVRPSSTTGCCRGRPDPSPPISHLSEPIGERDISETAWKTRSMHYGSRLFRSAGGGFLLVLLFLPFTRILVRSQSEGHSGSSPSGSGAGCASRATRLAACPCDQEGSESRSRPVASDPVLAPYRRTRLLAASRQVRRCRRETGSGGAPPSGLYPGGHAHRGDPVRGAEGGAGGVCDIDPATGRAERLQHHHRGRRRPRAATLSTRPR